jgi:hypothetical protein
MAAHIGLATGKDFIVEGTVDEVADKMIGADPRVMFESKGRRVYIFRAHVAYVEEQKPSVYERREAASG